MPIVSLIVPVFNAEKSLRRCVDSVLKQEYTDFELILADDGSKDGSGEICDEYAAMDSRVRVIHKENTGVSDTRNLAISQACGTYLQFLDSDDWITSDATKLMVREAEARDCDLVVADFYRVVGERVSRKGDIEEDGVMSREEYAAHMMENPADFYYGVLWNKLYRRDIIEAYGLRMDASISWCEDFMFNLEYIRHGERFYALQVPVYYYVKTKGSLVSQGISISKTIKMKMMVFEVYNDFYKHVLDDQEYEKNRLHVYRFLIDAANDSMAAPAILPGLGSKKLGDERICVGEEAAAGAGLLMDFYRERKLLERYLEVVSLKYDMPSAAVLLLYFLMESQEGNKGEVPLFTRRDFMDITGLSRGGLALALQWMVSKDIVEVKEVVKEKEKQPKGKGKKIADTVEKSGTAQETATAAVKPSRKKLLKISFLPAAEPMLEALKDAREDYRQASLQSLTEEEREQYLKLRGKLQDNIRYILERA